MGLNQVEINKNFYILFYSIQHNYLFPIPIKCFDIHGANCGKGTGLYNLIC